MDVPHSSARDAIPAATDGVAQAWAGIDIGKTHHWLCAIDDAGRVLLSERMANDEAELRDVIARACTTAASVTWAIDIIDTPAALLLAVLHDRPGR